MGHSKSLQVEGLFLLLLFFCPWLDSLPDSEPFLAPTDAFKIALFKVLLFLFPALTSEFRDGFLQDGRDTGRGTAMQCVSY